MKISAVKEAIKEAERFIKAAKKIQTGTAWDAKTGSYVPSKDYIEIGKDSGACRRASMDLTRALAEMRKP